MEEVAKMYPASLIFIVLFCLLFFHSKNTAYPLSIFTVLIGIILYIYFTVYMHYSKANSENMFMYQVIFNCLILIIVILLSPPRRGIKDNFEIPKTLEEGKALFEQGKILAAEGKLPVAEVKVLGEEGKLPVAEVKVLGEEGKLPDSRQIFEVSPIKRCCGGEYMRSGDPELNQFCKQFSNEEIINTCAARKNIYNGTVCQSQNSSGGCNCLKKIGSISVIGVT